MPYDRLPADAQNVVTEGVLTQAVEFASIHVYFMSNTDQIYVNFTLYNSNTDFDNMDALGHSSVDLYSWDTNTANDSILHVQQLHKVGHAIKSTIGNAIYTAMPELGANDLTRY